MAACCTCTTRPARPHTHPVHRPSSGSQNRRVSKAGPSTNRLELTLSLLLKAPAPCSERRALRRKSWPTTSATCAAASKARSAPARGSQLPCLPCGQVRNPEAKLRRFRWNRRAVAEPPRRHPKQKQRPQHVQPPLRDTNRLRVEKPPVGRVHQVGLRLVDDEIVDAGVV